MRIFVQAVQHGEIAITYRAWFDGQGDSLTEGWVSAEAAICGLLLRHGSMYGVVISDASPVKE